jgi:hypothetical protein
VRKPAWRLVERGGGPAVDLDGPLDEKRGSAPAGPTPTSRNRPAPRGDRPSGLAGRVRRSRATSCAAGRWPRPGLQPQGLTANAAMLRRLPEARRTATLLATSRALQVAAVDDALDPFAVLMTTKLIGPVACPGEVGGVVRG